MYCRCTWLSILMLYCISLNHRILKCIKRYMVLVHPISFILIWHGAGFWNSKTALSSWAGGNYCWKNSTMVGITEQGCSNFVLMNPNQNDLSKAKFMSAFCGLGQSCILKRNCITMISYMTLVLF